ncbi:MAG TPA: hypothetical protein VLV78_13150 [Thermoanaerobaculia bacterium]|nr:hypothetical protein [Thermoanaerobaculia bacterium]
MLIAVVVACAAVAHASEAPDAVAREFIKAVYSNDKAGFDKTIVPTPRAEILVGKQPLSFSDLNAVAREAAAMEFEVVQPFTLNGKRAAADEKGEYPVGTRLRYMTGFRGTPLIVTMRRTAAGWKVDPRWWLAMAEQGPEPKPKPGTPDFAIKAFVTAAVTNNRDDAARFLVPNSDMSVVFAEAPAEPDPSDQTVALAIEMPLVEIPPGELYALPSGQIVEGSRPDAAEKLFVGLYGAIELPFVVQRTAREWRVVAEPYFKLLNRQ